ncbi:MAG: hypothetical protein JWO22_4089 [Frankiales bacterium]|nr:hypothetical protein [Frankiales bacterium]
MTEPDTDQDLERPNDVPLTTDPDQQRDDELEDPTTGEGGAG